MFVFLTLVKLLVIVLKLFDLSLKFSGFPMKEANLEFDRTLAVPEHEYAGFIFSKQKEIVDFHLKHNPFYQQLYGKKVFENWEDLPVLTKKELQQPLQQRLAEGYTLKNTFVNKTSGSSGDPFIFAKDKFSHAITWSSYFYRFGWFGIDFNHSYQARFYGIPLDPIGYRKERIKDYLSCRFRFPIFDLSDAFLKKILFHFKTKKFDYIDGYTSSIVLFAKFLKSKNIILKTICPTLKVCMVTSEMLFEEDKILLEKQFGIPIVNEYGASELDLIAFQNPEGEWQVNTETLYVEILDTDNRPVPNGQEGRIVITSLYNKAHPFIRYDIGDIGILDEKSTPKKTLLKTLVGRTNDIAVLPSGKKSPGLTFYYVTKSVIEDDGNVKEFIIRQLKTDTFEIDYVSDHVLTASQIQKIEQAIALYLEPGLLFIFNQKASLERTSRGKLKQFQSLL